MGGHNHAQCRTHTSDGNNTQTVSCQTHTHTQHPLEVLSTGVGTECGVPRVGRASVSGKLAVPGGPRRARQSIATETSPAQNRRRCRDAKGCATSSHSTIVCDEPSAWARETERLLAKRRLELINGQLACRREERGGERHPATEHNRRQSDLRGQRHRGDEALHSEQQCRRQDKVPHRQHGTRDRCAPNCVLAGDARLAERLAVHKDRDALRHVRRADQGAVDDIGDHRPRIRRKGAERPQDRRSLGEHG
eukprot:508857-Prymnesium_polylepis.1